VQTKPRPKLLKLSEVRRHPELQPRVSIDPAIVEDYRDLLKEGVRFPAVTVFFDKMYYYLADGWHRYEAHQAAGIDDIQAEVYEGSFRDAKLHALGANAHHGLRRTSEDKRRAVGMLLADTEWSSWSDPDIAKACNVSRSLVQKIRTSSPATTTSDNRDADLDRSPGIAPPPAASEDVQQKAEDIRAAGGAPRFYKNKHGSVGVMDVSNLARKPNENSSPGIQADAQSDMESSRANPVEESSSDASTMDDVEFENYLNGLHSQIESLQRANDALSASDQGAEMMKQVQLLLNAENSLATERDRGAVREKALRWFGTQYAQLRNVLNVKNDRDVLAAVKKLVEEAK